MTTTYSTDAQVYLRGGPIAKAALDTINVWRTAMSLASVAIDDYRVEAQRQILVDLRNRGIDQSDISREDDLREPEVALTMALLCEAAQQRVIAARGQTQPELYAQQADWWRQTYRASIEAAAPIDDVRPVGRSFEWFRG